MTKQATLNSPPVAKPGRTLSLTARRASILVMYLGYLGFVILRPNAIAAIALLGLALAASAFLFLRTGYWNWGHAPDPRLDEREVAERNRRYREAYSGFVTLVVLGLVYCSMASDLGWWAPAGQPLLGGTLFLGLTLPSALLAWNDRPLRDE